MTFFSRSPVIDLLLTALAPAIWGTTYIVTSQFLPPDRPFIAALLRVLPAGIALFIWCRRFPLRNEWWKLIVTGILNIGAFQALLFIAAYRLPGGLAAVIGAIQPLLVMLLAWCVDRQRSPWLAVFSAGPGWVVLGAIKQIIGAFLGFYLLTRFPDLDAKGRERAIAKELGAVFLIGIGGKLSDGKRHDVRAPDYDDWSTVGESEFAGLNGDILVWNPVLEDAFELSSMGIRVDADALKHQLSLTGDEDRLSLEWHQALLRGEMPQTIGGGIGQSRLTMLLLQLPHIGQVQCGVWPAQVRESVASLL